MSKKSKKAVKTSKFYVISSGVLALLSVGVLIVYAVNIPKQQKTAELATQVTQKIDKTKQENESKEKEISKLKAEYEKLAASSQELVQKAEQVKKKQKEAEAEVNEAKEEFEKTKADTLAYLHTKNDEYAEASAGDTDYVVYETPLDGLKGAKPTEKTPEEIVEILAESGRRNGSLPEMAALDNLTSDTPINPYNLQLGHPEACWDNGYWLSAGLVDDLNSSSLFPRTSKLMNEAVGRELSNNELDKRQTQIYKDIQSIKWKYVYNLVAYGDPFYNIGYPTYVYVQAPEYKDYRVSKGSEEYDKKLGTNFSGTNPNGFLHHITYENN